MSRILPVLLSRILWVLAAQVELPMETLHQHQAVEMVVIHGFKAPVLFSQKGVPEVPLRRTTA